MQRQESPEHQADERGYRGRVRLYCCSSIYYLYYLL